MDYIKPHATLKADSSGRFYGYASVFDVTDTQKDVIEHGAFRATLMEYRLQRTLPRMFYEHKSEEEVGTWQHLDEDTHGLWVEGQLNLHTPSGLAALKAMEEERLLGLSIGFMAMRTSYQKGLRHIHHLKLFEISLVHLPANPLAVIG